MWLVGHGALAQNTLRDTILFDFDKYDLTQIAVDQLNKISKIIQREKIKSIELVGHTDHDGSDEYNVVLSKRRVNAVLNYLVSKDVEQNIITSDYSGEKVPIATNGNEAGRQKNRRVVLELNYGDADQKIKDADQKFKLHPYMKNEIKGKRGTKITIPRDAMVLALTGKTPCRSVNMKLRENYAEPDVTYFKQAIDTQGKELLVNGKIRFSAQCAKGELKIKGGMKIKLELYTEYEGAEVYIGKYTKDGIKWVRLSNSYVNVPDFGQVLFYMVAP